jgi:hypothetical protein
MSRFDKFQKKLFVFFDLLGYSYEVLELGDSEDNWFMSVELDDGREKFVINFEDATAVEECGKITESQLRINRESVRY